MVCKKNYLDQHTPLDWKYIKLSVKTKRFSAGNARARVATSWHQVDKILLDELRLSLKSAVSGFRNG